jgi:oligoendopeptidase F
MENSVPLRSEVKNKYKWDIDTLYFNKEGVLRDTRKLNEMIEEIQSYKGRLTESADTLYSCLKIVEKASRLCEVMSTYTFMKRDEDNSNVDGQELADLGQKISVEFESAVSFINPEIIAAGEEKINKLIDEKKELKLYKHYIHNILRQGKHILSPKEEKIIAQTGEMASSMVNTFKMLSIVDIKMPSVKNSKGEEIELTANNFTKLLTSEDRILRKNAFNTFYGEYEEYKNTFGALIAGSNKADIFYAKVKGFDSALDKALFDENIPRQVYFNVIDSVSKNIDALDSYCEMKKKMLNVSELHLYDLYAPIVKNVDSNVEFEEGKEMVLEGLSILGDDYINILKEAFDNNWIDVYENKGKCSGAYSWGCYDTKPYILLNYNNKLNDVLTMSHELGHSVHSYKSRKNQPYVYSQYTIFCAEVASITNECLMYLYLMDKLQGDERKYIINEFLELIRTTYFRQTMFAEFELQSHTLIEKGESLNGEKASEIWLKLYEKYYGRYCVIDKGIEMEWARIPHFYNAYYVYKYVTGLSAAISIAKSIVDDRKNVDRYMEYLKSGGSDYSIELLKKAGVDMTTSKPMDDAAEMFRYLLKEFNK